MCVRPDLSVALDHRGRDNGSNDEETSRTETIQCLPPVTP
jgi:hypothetical protein